MNILVLGSEGYIGESIVSEFDEFRIFRYDINTSEIDLSLNFFLENKVDLIINLINRGLVNNQITEDVWNANNLVPLKLVNILQQLGSRIPVIHISTREAIGETFKDSDVELDFQGRLVPKRAFCEDVQENPKNLFGWSKLAAEKIIASYSHGIIARLATPYTDFLYQNRGGLVSKLGFQSKVEQKVTLAGGGGQFRDPLHVKDLANFCKLVISAKKFVPGIYHLGGGINNYLSLKEMVLEINSECEIRYQEGGDLGFTFDISKAYSTYGWKPEINFLENLKFFKFSKF